MNLTNILIGIIALHFVGGFGYLIYKLSPRKEDKQNVKNQNVEKQNQKINQNQNP